MKFNQFIDTFVHDRHGQTFVSQRYARMLFKSFLFTSLFSANFLVLSIYTQFEEAIYLMVFNVLGFQVLLFMLKSKISLKVLANAYVAVGAIAVIILAIYSDGLFGPLYPWVIAIPVLALLVAGRKSSIYWAVISGVAMLTIGTLSVMGYEFPIAYDISLKAVTFLGDSLGLMLLIFIISLTFERNRSNAVLALQDLNHKLEEQRDELAVRKDELHQLLEDKDYIINILAHDLRNPLQTINGLIDIFKKEPLNDEYNEWLDQMQQATQRSNELINKVLQLGAAEQNKIKLKLERVHVNELIHSTSAAYQRKAESKSIRIVNETLTDFYVHGDVICLTQVLDNLMSNAIKFSPQNGEVIISCSKTGNQVQIRIRDTGPGVSAKDMTHLWDKFTTLTARPTGGESSTGLGLSIVLRMTQMMNGTVWCENIKNAGAEFVVEMPASANSIFLED